MNPAKLLTSMCFSGPEWLQQYNEGVPKPFNSAAERPPAESSRGEQKVRRTLNPDIHTLWGGFFQRLIKNGNRCLLSVTLVNYFKKVLDHFWQRWIREYLLELRNIHRLKIRAPEEPQISVGDIVIVYDDNRRRAAWNLGRVVTVKTAPPEEQWGRR